MASVSTDLKLKTQVDGSEKTKRELRGVQDSTNKVGGAAKSVTSSLTKFAAGFISLSAAIAGFNKVVSKSIEFSKATNEVKAFLAPSERTAENIKAITDEAKRVGKQLPLMNADILRGAVALEKAGFSASEVTDALEGVSKMAVVAGLSVDESAEQAADTMRSFSLTSKEVGKVMDTISVAATSSSQNFVDLKESMKFANVGMVEAGQSIEEVATLLSLMANKGLKGSIAGTSLNQAMIKLSKNVDMATGQIDGLNTKLINQDGSFRDITDIIKDLQVEMADYTEIQRTNTLQNIAGVRGARAFGVLMRTNADDIDNLKGKVKNATGSLNEMTDIMREGIAGAAQDVGAQFDSLLLTLGEFLAIEKILRLLADSIAFLDSFLSDLGNTVKNHPFMTGAFIGGISTIATAIISALVPAITAAAGAIGALTMAALPWLAAGAVIAGLVGGIYWLVANWDIAVGKIKEVWNTLLTNIRFVAVKVSELFVNMFSSVVSIITQSKNAVVEAFTRVFDGAKNAVSNSIDWMIEKVKSLLNFIADIPRMVANTVKNVLPGSRIGGAIMNLFGGARAMGGPVQSGKTYLVGENGPEMFTPKVSGNITPNHNLGGGTTINISGVFGSDAAEELGNMIVDRLKFNVAI